MDKVSELVGLSMDKVSELSGLPVDKVSDLTRLLVDSTLLQVDNVNAALIMGLLEAQKYIFSTYLYQRFKEIMTRCS